MKIFGGQIKFSPPTVPTLFTAGSNNGQKAANKDHSDSRFVADKTRSHAMTVSSFEEENKRLIPLDLDVE